MQKHHIIKDYDLGMYHQEACPHNFHLNVFFSLLGKVKYKKTLPFTIFKYMFEKCLLFYMNEM